MTNCKFNHPEPEHTTMCPRHPPRARVAASRNQFMQETISRPLASINMRTFSKDPRTRCAAQCRCNAHQPNTRPSICTARKTKSCHETRAKRFQTEGSIGTARVAQLAPDPLNCHRIQSWLIRKACNSARLADNDTVLRTYTSM